MADDALDTVLRLVADGRLTAEEAGPILDALATGAPQPTPDPRPAGGPPRLPVTGPAGPSGSRSPKAAARSSTCACPLALGRAALARVPGLSEATADRIREAIEAGIRARSWPWTKAAATASASSSSNP